MTLSLGFFTFINVWWVMLFMVLPFGVRMETPKNGLDYAGAPKAKRWKKLFLINSGISLVVTLMLAVLINSHVIPLDTIKGD